MATATKEKDRTIERCIVLRSGSFYVIKRNKWSEAFATIEEARRYRDRIESEQAPKPQGGPFADFMRKYYYPNYVANWKTNSINSSKAFFEGTMIPYFADKKIGDITKIDCLGFRQEMQKTLSPISINGRMTYLRMVMRAAVDLGFIQKNPATNIKQLREDKTDRHTLNEDEIVDLINSIDHPYKYAIAIAGLAGARAGEVMGFKWDDFTFTEDGRGKITFARSINQAGNVESLKSPASYATLPMLPSLIALLKEWKELCPDDEWLFQGDVRKHVVSTKWEGYKKKRRRTNMQTQMKADYTAPNYLSKWWVGHVQGTVSGIPRVPKVMRFHDLRHSFVTFLVERIPNVKTVQKFARHSDVNITLQIYAHVKPEQLDIIYSDAF